MNTEFAAMLRAAIDRNKQEKNLNIRQLAAALKCSHGTLLNAAAGKINPPMKHLEAWSLLCEPQDRDRFIQLGAATKLGKAANRALSTKSDYSAGDTEARLAEALMEIERLKAELAEARAGAVIRGVTGHPTKRPRLRLAAPEPADARRQ